MPRQKDLKRIVRSRMQKTGESYTAARLQVLKKKEPDYAELAGMSEAAISKATGRTWAEWVKTLDAVSAVNDRFDLTPFGSFGFDPPLRATRSISGERAPADGVGE